MKAWNPAVICWYLYFFGTRKGFEISAAGGWFVWGVGGVGVGGVELMDLNWNVIKTTHKKI